MELCGQRVKVAKINVDYQLNMKSKNNMQYIREARFFRNGFDGLMQLGAVYKITLDMIGNTLYYPGMEIYLDPLFFL